MKQEAAILAGGCFWGMQDLLRRYPGVISTRVGYTGDDVPNATYGNHGNHAEAIEILFDPAKLSYRKLLEFFFKFTILPPAIVKVMTSGPATVRLSSTPQKNRSGLPKTPLPTSIPQGFGRGEVVTEVVPAGPFWQAEP
jgi:peptide-methionine (S)-S-oxide reductase